MLQKLVEVRRVIARFPTGEIKQTEYVEMRWVDIDQPYTVLNDEVLCSPSSDYDGVTHRRI